MLLPHLDTSRSNHVFRSKDILQELSSFQSGSSLCFPIPKGLLRCNQIETGDPLPFWE